MNGINLVTLIALLERWENEHLSRLPANTLPFFSQGGWEGWLQVELATFFLEAQYDVVREQKAYDNSKKADLVFNTLTVQSPEIVVEIKCESIYIEKVDAFLSKIHEDERKLSTLPEHKYGIMLVGVTEQDAEDKLIKEGYFLIPTVQNNMHLLYKVIKRCISKNL